ncbi:hypothetical protein N0V87_005401 [Didymella glomerata]|uniref:Uncharacterized protein n=1 Tax=Didymella glomerata TaxID=749621 RepID=A0A9W9BZS4_9PLEO|nr:hypothetical protein N0V87_005401 [Didymella glomerata]
MKFQRQTIDFIAWLLAAKESDAVIVERQANDVISSEIDNGDGGADAAATLALEESAPASAIKDASWEIIKQEVIPPYIKSVAFTVTSDDLNPERQKDLENRFPGVSMITGTSPVQAQLAAEQWLQRTFGEQVTPTISTSTAATKPPELMTSVKAVAEVVPTTPTPTTTTATTATPTGPRRKVSLLERMTSGLTESRFGNIRSPTSAIDAKQFDKSPILRVASQIGLTTQIPGKVLHAMWLQWKDHSEVRPFSAVKGVKLVQYYENLVTLYILAYHKEEFDLCFALLLRFQSTNYTFRNEFPGLATAVLAFQYLPEDSDLCRWIATLFAFLWPTQGWDSHEQIVTTLPQIEKQALSKFLFAVAYIRDPHTKGHNTAVLAQWCAVHRHEEGDHEYGACRKSYAFLEDQFDKIRKEEAKHEFDEANRIVEDHTKNLRLQLTTVDTGQSAPLKRKAESLTVSSQKKYKRGGGRGRGRGGSTG